MTLFRSLAVICTVILASGLYAGPQRKQEPPSITFGGAQVSLGMTVELVEKNLAASTRHIEFLADKRTAVVRLNGASVPNGDEGQVTFADGHLVYAAFNFPVALNADQLAQELAGLLRTWTRKSAQLETTVVMAREEESPRLFSIAVRRVSML